VPKWHVKPAQPNQPSQTVFNFQRAPVLYRHFWQFWQFWQLSLDSLFDAEPNIRFSKSPGSPTAAPSAASRSYRLPALLAASVLLTAAPLAAPVSASNAASVPGFQSPILATGAPGKPGVPDRRAFRLAGWKPVFGLLGWKFGDFGNSVCRVNSKGVPTHFSRVGAAHTMLAA